MLRSSRSPTATAAAALTLASIFLLSACSSDFYEPDSREPSDAASQEASDSLPIAPAADEQPGGGIAWNQAAENAGTNQRVCGPLAGGGNSDDDVFLNLGRDYPDPGRFQIVVWDVGSLEPIDGGATLCVSGQITMYEGVAQIELTDPSLIEILN